MARDTDFDTCIYCEVTGCETGTAVHADDCPSETGVFPVREDDLYERVTCEKCGHRNYVGMGCWRCETMFEPGDFYHQIEIGPQRYEVVCAGCAIAEAFGG